MQQINRAGASGIANEKRLQHAAKLLLKGETRDHHEGASPLAVREIAAITKEDMEAAMRRGRRKR